MRTRPDILYLRTPRPAYSTIAAALLATPIDVPMFVRKAEPNSSQILARMLRPQEMHLPGDWFFIMPIAWGRYIFARAYSVVDFMCHHRQFQVARSRGAELFLLRREMFSDRGLPLCDVTLDDVTRIPPPHGGTPRELLVGKRNVTVPGCVASLPVVVVRADGEVDCSRVAVDRCPQLADDASAIELAPDT